MSRYRHIGTLVRGVAVLSVISLVVVLSVTAAWFNAEDAALVMDHSRHSRHSRDSSHSRIQYSRVGAYAFPVSGDPNVLSWTSQHWDGSHAVDLFARHELSIDSPDFQAFKQRHIVAVTSGTARRVDNERGGIAVLLHGDDERVYYFAHLQSSSIPTKSAEDTGSAEWAGAVAERVEVGQSLGVIGNTGRWTQYIEPHLHFSVASREAPSPGFAPDINAAGWLKLHFGLNPIPWPEPSYRPASPSGPPLTGPFEISRSFSAYMDSSTANPDMASVDLVPSLVTARGTESPPVPVFSPLLGEVRVHRTTRFGLRVQVTNRHTDETVVLSGLDSLSVQTGDIVERGTPLGTTQGKLNIMHFDKGKLSDPVAFF